MGLVDAWVLFGANFMLGLVYLILGAIQSIYFRILCQFWACLYYFQFLIYYYMFLLSQILGQTTESEKEECENNIPSESEKEEYKIKIPSNPSSFTSTLAMIALWPIYSIYE